jgi:putative flippase GtrA
LGLNKKKRYIVLKFITKYLLFIAVGIGLLVLMFFIADKVLRWGTGASYLVCFYFGIAWSIICNFVCGISEIKITFREKQGRVGEKDL